MTAEDYEKDPGINIGRLLKAKTSLIVSNSYYEIGNIISRFQISHVQSSDCINDTFGDNKVPIQLIIHGDYIPGCPVDATFVEYGLVCSHVIIPTGTITNDRSTFNEDIFIVRKLTTSHPWTLMPAITLRMVPFIPLVTMHLTFIFVSPRIFWEIIVQTNEFTGVEDIPGFKFLFFKLLHPVRESVNKVHFTWMTKYCSGCFVR